MNLHYQYNNSTLLSVIKRMTNVLDCDLTISKFDGCARGVIVIVLRNGHGDSSSNPGRD